MDNLSLGKVGICGLGLYIFLFFPFIYKKTIKKYMDEKKLEHEIMYILSEILDMCGNLERRPPALTNRIIKRLRDRVVDFVKECKKV